MWMGSECFDEMRDGLKTAFQSRSALTFNKPLCGSRGAIFPVMLEVVFQDPSSMDPVIPFAKGI